MMAVLRSIEGISGLTDPPIAYPNGQVWQELTARRRQKYSATELVRRSPTEWKVEQALEQPTQIEFVQTPTRGSH